jgi:hypothetical protein
VSKKNQLQPWRTERFCIPEKDHPRFVAQMEEILDVYCEESCEDEPLICMDESARQIVSDLLPPLPMEPGHPRREDHHYQRQGTQALFLFFNPLAGWRRVSSRDRRTRVDWAEEVRRLLEEDYPQARKVKLVCDNLNTHHKGSLYAAFDAQTAHRLSRRLELYYTPRNGSWLNMAEMELSILGRQCLNRRFHSIPHMQSELQAWQTARNKEHCGAQWRFTTSDARIKLRRLYPHG